MSPNPLNDDAALKRLLALVTVLWAMFIATAILVCHVVLTVKNISWTPPEVIQRLVEGTIFSAVVVLGGATTAIVRGYIAKKDKK